MNKSYSKILRGELIRRWGTVWVKWRIVRIKEEIGGRSNLRQTAWLYGTGYGKTKRMKVSCQKMMNECGWERCRFH